MNITPTIAFFSLLLISYYICVLFIPPTISITTSVRSILSILYNFYNSNQKSFQFINYQKYNFSGKIKSNILYKNEYENINSAAFFQSCPIPTFLLDNNFNILVANEATEKIFNNENFNNKNFLSLLTKDSKEIVQASIKSSSNIQNFPPIEVNLNNSDKIILLYFNNHTYKEKEFYIFKLIDITKYKNLEANFIHSQKMQALGKLSGAIVHDFNNLLTAIIGFCDLLLLKHPKSSESYEELKQIKQNSNRAANLVRQLLLFSRKQSTRPKLVNISESLNELAGLITSLIGNDIELIIKQEKELPQIKMDPGQFEQIIINLIVNSRDAMQNNGKLTISTAHVKIEDKFDETDYFTPPGDEVIAKGDYVLITISDTGTGIKEDILNKIFEPFFSTKDTLLGTGFGLSTVFDIIKQLGGHIRLKTKINKGTIFYIFFKIVKSNKLQAFENNDIPQTMQNISNIKKGKILVVEDEAPVRMFTIYALNSKGYQVLEADSAEHAIEIIEKEGKEIALVITDVVMPGMTGLKLFDTIKHKYPEIRFIITSGYEKDVIDNLNKIDCHFLNKPYSLEEFLTTVNNSFNEK